MKKFFGYLFLAAFAAIFVSGVSAQTERDLELYFEGKRVEVKIDMPASRGGVNIYPERRQMLDFDHYRDLLKKYGVGVREGDRIMITKIKIKDKHIEFQLGGGGYGGWTDETSPDIYVSPVGKTEREKNLEKDLKKETNEQKRRQIREELSDLRRKRERENARNEARVSTAEELARQRIQDKRQQAGSRFNIRFERRLESVDLTPEAIIEALSEYVEFID